MDSLKKEILRAVWELALDASGSGVSFAQIARHVFPDPDTHNRDLTYNRTVKATKELIEEGWLCYKQEPIAGHPAKIGYP